MKLPVAWFKLRSPSPGPESPTSRASGRGDMWKLARNRGRQLLLFVVAFFVSIDETRAHDQVPGEPQTRPIVIRGATIHVVDGPTIEKGSVLLEDGKIVSVGRNFDVPDDALTLDASGKRVYPGLIESMTDLGLREISAVGETR